MFHDNNYILQQDGAQSHTNPVIQQFFNENAPGFMEKDEWPLLSPDLNPLDYRMWDLRFTEEEPKNLLRKS